MTGLKIPLIYSTCIFKCMSSQNFMLSRVEHEKSFITLGSGILEKNYTFSAKINKGEMYRLICSFFVHLWQNSLSHDWTQIFHFSDNAISEEIILHEY